VAAKNSIDLDTDPRAIIGSRLPVRGAACHGRNMRKPDFAG
jgi:hypothetical protein